MKNITLETEITKRDIDKYGHANYSKHMELYELGHLAFLKSIGLGFKDLEEGHGLRTLIRAVNIEYLGQLYEGDRVSIQTAVDNVGNTSMHYKQSIAKGDKVVSTADMVAVFTNIKGEKQRIPDDIRAKLG